MGRAPSLLELAGRHALFFLLDFHNQVFLRPDMAALVVRGTRSRAASAVAAAATTTAAEQAAKARALRQAKLLAGVGVTPLFHFLGLRIRDADAFVAATVVPAAAAPAAALLAAGLTAGLDNNDIIRLSPAGQNPCQQCAQSKGEELT
jgi:hypothetical protein